MRNNPRSCQHPQMCPAPACSVLMLESAGQSMMSKFTCMQPLFIAIHVWRVNGHCFLLHAGDAGAIGRVVHIPAAAAKAGGCSAPAVARLAGKRSQQQQRRKSSGKAAAGSFASDADDGEGSDSKSCGGTSSENDTDDSGSEGYAALASAAPEPAASGIPALDLKGELETN